jgi:hypothetical protein
MQKKRYILILLLLMASQSLAQDFRKAGTTGFVFLEIPVSARSQAMGESGLSLIDAGTDGLFINPALITHGDAQYALGLIHSNWYVDTRHQAAAALFRVPAVATFGISVIHFDFGEIEKTRNPSRYDTGEFVRLGTYTAGATAIGLSLARQLTDQFSFGVTFKYVRETIDEYSADNIVSDIGFIYRTGFSSLRIGTFLQSFGLETKYAAEKFKMPQQLRMGLSGELFGEITDPDYLTVLVEAVHPNDADERIHLGSEWVLRDVIALRGGYKFGYDEEGVTLGLGLRFVYEAKKVTFDLAWARHQRLESTIRYALGVEF